MGVFCVSSCCLKSFIAVLWSRLFKDFVGCSFTCFLLLGGRTADEIVNWLNKKTGPASKVIASKEESDKYIADSEVVVLSFFPVSVSYFVQV